MEDKEKNSWKPNDKLAITIALIRLGGQVLFMAGVFTKVWSLVVIGGLIMVVDEIILSFLFGTLVGAFNLLFIVLFSVFMLAFAVFIHPWYYGIFWGLAIYKMISWNFKKEIEILSIKRPQPIKALSDSIRKSVVENINWLGSFGQEGTLFLRWFTFFIQRAKQAWIVVILLIFVNLAGIPPDIKQQAQRVVLSLIVLFILFMLYWIAVRTRPQNKIKSLVQNLLFFSLIGGCYFLYKIFISPLLSGH